MDPTKRKLDTVIFRKLSRNFTDPVFRDAYQSYKEIYNNAMAKGKGNLDPRSLAGNPIQLESTNMGSLFKKPGVYSDYFVSTKADGLRFMLLIGNKSIDNSRTIYFVDVNLNFWIIEDLPTIPSYLNVDKTLIDGELLFWGKTVVKRSKTTREILEYQLHKFRNIKPFIGFLAFDILYGPTNPDYVREDLSKIPIGGKNYGHGSKQPPPKFQLGSFGAMVGLKAQTLSDSKVVRWPTTRRRKSLEQMFLNSGSPLWHYLHSASANSSLIESSTKEHRGDQYLDVIPEQVTVFNFSIFVSPFIPMNELFDKYKKGCYDFMIKNLQTSIEKQFFFNDPTGHSANLNTYPLTLPKLPARKRADFGKGYFTDGLILTPAHQPYIVGPWTFCNNKQYKWKPILTADFQVGKLKTKRTEVKGDNKQDIYIYLALARSTVSKEAKKMEPFNYKFGDVWYTALISSVIELKKGSIVECEVTKDKLPDQILDGDDSPTNYFFFDYVMERPDKIKPNADNTVASIIKASNIDKEYEFVYQNSINFRISELYKESDAYYYYSTTNVSELKVPGTGLLFNRKLPVLIRSSKELMIGRVYAGVYNGIIEDNLVFDKVAKKRGSNSDPNSIQFSQRKFEEMYQTPSEYKKNYLPNTLDLVFIIKEQGNYLNKDQREKVLLAFGENRLKKCYVQNHPLCLLDNSEQDLMKDLIIQRQGNSQLELELQVKFRDPRYSYANCLIDNFIGSDYIPVPVIKAYGKNDRRTTYAKIGEDTLIPEETIIKRAITDPVDVRSELFNYDFGLVLSEERKTKGEVKKATAYEYQNRYTITSLSSWWRLDIIEFGNARENWESAKNWWEQRPKTRVELEYDPGAYFKDIANWEDPKAIQAILGNLSGKVENVEDLKSKVNAYVQELNKADPEVILNDLTSVLVKIFRTLDMDYGNIDRRKMKKDEVKDQKEQKKNQGRANSVWIRMRNFNNYVKRQLIENAAKAFDNPSLFDVSVGRGGDMDKWFRAGVKKVRGIDPNSESIEEAERRFKGRKDLKGLDYQFAQERISDPTVELPQGFFDIVSCQFTLHYFFENDEILDRSVSRIAEKLSPGGLFIGTAIIGDRVEEMETDEVEIKILGNNSYNFKLKDVAESGNYFDIQNQVEYFVDFEDFVDVCASYGLVLVDKVPFREYYAVWPSRRKQDEKMKSYEKEISFMYDTFIFQKIDKKVQKYATPKDYRKPVPKKGSLKGEYVEPPLSLAEEYNILQLSGDATRYDLRKKYREMALIYHPDKNSSEDAREYFLAIKDAYNKLSKHLK